MSEVLRILGAVVAGSRCWGVATLLSCGLLLAACGQKGPLFLPSPPASVSPSPR